MKNVAFYLLLLFLAACRAPEKPPAPICESLREQLQESIDLFDRQEYGKADTTAFQVAAAALDSGCAIIWVKARTLMANSIMQYDRDRAVDSLLHDLEYANTHMPEVAGIIHFWLGYLYNEAGEYWNALRHYEAARAAHEQGSVAVVSRLAGQHLYKPLANIYTRLGDNERAIFILKTALDSCRNEKDYYGGACVHSDMGIAFMNAGLLDSAGMQFNLGLASSFSHPSDNEGRNAEIRALLYSNWAESKFAQGEYDTADTMARHSLEFDPDMAEAYMVLGEKAALEGRPDDADGHFRKAETISKNYYPLRELAKVMLRRVRLAADRNPANTHLLQMCNDALSLVLPHFHPENDYENPDPDTFYPENTILEALDLKSHILWKQSRLTVNGDGLLQYADTTTALALQSADMLNATYGFESSVLYSLEYTRALHERYFAILFERYRRFGASPDRIVAFSERSRALLLRQKLAADAALQRSRDHATTLDEETVLRTELAEQKNNLVEMEAYGDPPELIEAQKKKIFRLEEKWAALRKNLPSAATDASDEVATLKAIQDFLPSDSAMLVEYFYNSESGALYQIGIRRQGIHIVQNSLSAANLEAFIAFVRDEDAAKNRTDIDRTYRDQFVQEARMLYDTLLGRVAGDLPLKELIVVPDGILGAFPFDLLLTKDAPKEAGFRQLPYLFREVAVRFAASATVLLRGNEEAPWRKPVAGYVGVAPSYRSLTFPWVEYSQGCVSSVSRVFHGQYAGGTVATRDRFLEMAPRCRILHFYGHGRADNLTPERSYLAFTSGTADTLLHSGLLAAASQLPVEEVPNVLFAQQISLMRLQADLVVLSACETGVGKIVGGEGVLSLARAFLDAGCPSAAMTLWSVDDEATDQLSQAFLRHIREGMRKDRALQRAKIEFLESGKSAAPFYWSGFVLTGNADPVRDIPEGCYLYFRGKSHACSELAGMLALLAGVLLLLLAIFRYRPV
ncbi:MAG: CHAT domain-containing tetratricopeptide repeat protein [Saprospiraceae bacterium]